MHYPFLVRASLYCRASGDLEPAASDSAGGALLEPAADGGDCLAGEAVKTCLRGQTFFSLGLRFLYAFIPLVSRAHVGWPGHGAAAGTGEARLQWPPQAAVVSGQSAVLPPAQVMWCQGGTWLLLGTLVEVTLLYVLDQL